MQGPLRGSYQDLHKIFWQGPAHCTRSCKNLLEGTSPRSPQDLLIRTCARSCKDLRMWAGSSQDLLITTCTKSRKDLRQDLISVLTASSRKDVYKTLVKIITYHGPPRLNHETLARLSEKDLARTQGSLCEDLKQAAKMSTAPQRERSDTHKVPRRLREPCENSDSTRTKSRGCASTC